MYIYADWNESYLQERFSFLVLILRLQHDTQFLQQLFCFSLVVIHDTIEDLQINIWLKNIYIKVYN